jgi:hypothetical protein
MVDGLDCIRGKLFSIQIYKRCLFKAVYSVYSVYSVYLSKVSIMGRKLRQC